MSFSVKFPGRSLWVVEYTFNLCIVYPRRQSSSDHLPQPFHLHVTYGTLNLTPLLLFIRPRTNQRPQPKPKIQYIILGPYPYNIHWKIIIPINDKVREKPINVWIEWSFFAIFFFFLSLFVILALATPSYSVKMGRNAA